MENTAIWVKLATQKESKSAGMPKKPNISTAVTANGSNQRFCVIRATTDRFSITSEACNGVATVVIASPFPRVRPSASG